MRSRKKLLPVATVAAGLLVTGLGGAAHAAEPGGGDTVTPAPADPAASDSPDNLVRIILAAAVRELLHDLLQPDDQADDPEAAARAVRNSEQLPLPTPPAPVPSLPDPGVTPSPLPTPSVPLVPPLPTPAIPPLSTPALPPLPAPALPPLVPLPSIPPVSVLPLPAPFAEPPVEPSVVPPVGDLPTGPAPGTTSDAPADQPATG